MDGFQELERDIKTLAWKLYREVAEHPTLGSKRKLSEMVRAACRLVALLRRLEVRASQPAETPQPRRGGMIRLLVRELKLTAGHVLQLAATRLLASRAGLRSLEGDQLSIVAGRFGCQRESDDALRARAREAARQMTGDDAEYGP